MPTYTSFHVKDTTFFQKIGMAGNSCEAVLYETNIADTLL